MGHRTQYQRTLSYKLESGLASYYNLYQIFDKRTNEVLESLLTN